MRPQLDATSPPARSSMAVNAGWLMGSRLAGDLLGVGMFIAIARQFGPEGVGTYATAFAVAGLVATVANPALGDFAMRNMARAAPAERNRRFAVLVRLEAGFALLAGLLLVAWLSLSSPASQDAIACVLLSVYLGGFAMGRVFYAPAFAAERMHGPSLAESACRGAAVLIGLLLLWQGLPLAVVLAPFPVAGLVYVLLAIASARRHGVDLRSRVPLSAILADARDGAPLFAAETCSQVHARLDYLLLTLLVGEAATGLFSTTTKVIEIGTVPLLFLTLAALPRLSRQPLGRAESDGRTAGEPLARELFELVAFLGGGLALAIFFVLPWLVEPVFGPAFAPVLAILPWTALWAALMAAEIVLIRLLLANDLQAAYLHGLLLAIVVKIALGLLLIPWLGLAGAAIAAVVSLACLIAWGSLAIGRLWPAARQWRALRVPLAALALAMAGGLAANGLAGAVAGIAASLAIYLAAAALGGTLRWRRISYWFRAES